VLPARVIHAHLAPHAHALHPRNQRQAPHSALSEADEALRRTMRATSPLRESYQHDAFAPHAVSSKGDGCPRSVSVLPAIRPARVPRLMLDTTMGRINRLVHHRCRVTSGRVANSAPTPALERITALVAVLPGPPNHTVVSQYSSL